MWPQEAEQAFEKVFARYGSNGVIERPCPSLLVVRRSRCKLESIVPRVPHFTSRWRTPWPVVLCHQRVHSGGETTSLPLAACLLHAYILLVQKVEAFPNHFGFQSFAT